jgi:hypothetical protein
MIIIGEATLFEPKSSLVDSARLHPVFICLDFATVFFLLIKVVSLASNPQQGGPSPCTYVPL